MAKEEDKSKHSKRSTAKQIVDNKSKKSNKLIKFNKQTERKRRQEYTEELYKTNGSIYMVSRDYIVQNNSLFSDNMFYHEVPKSRIIDQVRVAIGTN